MTAVICTYPLDVVRARLAFQVKGEHRYTGIANAFHTIYLKVVLVQCPAVVHTYVITYSSFASRRGVFGASIGGSLQHLLEWLLMQVSSDHLWSNLFSSVSTQQ